MARVFGAILFGSAAVAVVLGVLSSDRELTMRLLREVAPLAAAIGAVLGASVFKRWPSSATHGVVIGLMSALVAIIFFFALYIFGESVIVAVQGGAPGQAVEDAVSRLVGGLPLGLPLGLAAFAAASLVMWMLGAIGRAFKR